MTLAELWGAFEEILSRLFAFYRYRLGSLFQWFWYELDILPCLYVILAIVLLAWGIRSLVKADLSWPLKKHRP
jgi:hypothetical protein